MNWGCLVISWEDWGERWTDWTIGKELWVSELSYWQLPSTALHDNIRESCARTLTCSPMEEEFLWRGLCGWKSRWFPSVWTAPSDSGQRDSTGGYHRRAETRGKWASSWGTSPTQSMWAHWGQEATWFPRVIRATHNVFCTPVHVFKVKMKGWWGHAAFCTAFITMAEG